MTGTEAAADLLAPGVVIRVPAVERCCTELAELTPVAVALAAGAAVDLIGVGDWVFLTMVGVADTVGVAAPAGELAGVVMVRLGVAAMTVGAAWPPEGVVG